jgi:hypothetical protein
MSWRPATARACDWPMSAAHLEAVPKDSKMNEDAKASDQCKKREPDGHNVIDQFVVEKRSLGQQSRLYDRPDPANWRMR